MDKLIESAPEIIGEAAKSPLGIFALMILALSVLGFFFFRKSSERTRTAMFVLMFIGGASFGYATFRTASGGSHATSTGGPQQSQGPSASVPSSEYGGSCFKWSCQVYRASGPFSFCYILY